MIIAIVTLLSLTLGFMACKKWYHKFFPKSETDNKAAAEENAIRKLQDLEDSLLKKVAYLEQKMEKETQTATKLARKNKRQALMALKRKRTYEKQLQQAYGTLSTIEFQRTALENVKANKTIVDAMSSGAKSMKSSQSQMDPDKIHDLMDDIAEQQEDTNEITEALAKPMGNRDLDDDELLRELEELEQDDLNAKLVTVPETSLKSIKFPEPPKDTLGKEKTLVTKPKKTAESARETKRNDEDQEAMTLLESWAAST